MKTIHYLRLRGVFKDFDTESVNSYLVSNLNAKAEGTVEGGGLLYDYRRQCCVFGGTKNQILENFSFAIMKNDGTGINKLLTTIGNLFTKSNSKDKDQ